MVLSHQKLTTNVLRTICGAVMLYLQFDLVPINYLDFE